MDTRTHRSFTIAVVAALALAAGSAGAQSPLTLGPLFQDHAVLQRDKPIPVWGSSGAGEEITVALAGRQVTARADASGRWTAALPAIGAGGPFTLDVRSSSGVSRTASDILVGDVFLCSGQSNMEFGVAQSRGGEFLVNRSANDKIRLFSVAHTGKPQPAPSFDPLPAWLAAGPQSVRTFSAACFLFGREVQTAQKVPVGLVHASWGGTAIEPWIGDSGLRALGGFETRLDLLPIFARDEDAANQRYGQLWENWWRSHGPSAGEPWKSEDAGPWTNVPELKNWKTWGVPETADLNGMVWYRRTFTLTAAQAAGAASLSLGGIDEVDQTWVNGRVIRNTFGWGTRRTYRLPAGTLRAGENLLVVNVLSTYDAGGMIGPPDAIALTCEDGTKIPLGAEWKYRAVPVSMGRAPRAPWETISGLTTLYNGMIAPMGPYAFRGALWYQGETNADEPAEYQKLLGGLFANWRARFGADLPFLVVQLPNYGPVPVKPSEANWADLRESQRRAVAADAHAGLAVTIDIGEANNLHPSNKLDVGRRLWRAARKVIYGEAIAPSGPVPMAARRTPAGIVVSFSDVEKEFVTYSASQAIAFELCGAAKESCRFVGGDVRKHDIVLKVPPVAGFTPVRVRFCWGASPLCNLSDGSGLPVVPFELPIK
jgi:sialate O-acetylesterase